MSADTGVGPAMASGSQMYNGTCALLPAQPRKRNSAIASTTDDPAIPPSTACAPR